MLFDNEVNLVEQLGHALDLIDHDQRRIRPQALPDQARVTREPEEHRLVEQIVKRVTVQLLSDQRGLPGLPRSEQKMGFAAQ